MADKNTEQRILAIGLEYEKDGANKTAYIKIPNPRNNLTEQQIKEATQKLLDGAEPILRSTTGAPLDSSTAIVTAYTEYVKTTEYDIGVE